MLEQHEVAAYLLQRRLVSRRSVVAGHLRIADASSRNRNFRVTGSPGSQESYLLKQALTDDGAQTLANEFALYRRLARPDSPMARHVPRVYGFHRAAGVLTIEWIAGGLDLYRVHAARTRASTVLAAALGRALAALHAVAPDEEQLRCDPPWVLSLHRPPLDALRYLSAASIELIASIQRDEPFAAALDDLRAGWRVEALVHRDVKLANCIAVPAPQQARLTRVALVDWEMAGWGDPALDVGSAIGELLGFGLATIPDGLDPRDRRGAEQAQRPWPAVRPALASLWRAYARARGLSGRPAEQLLARSVRYAAARLVQSGYEDTQEAGCLTARIGSALRLARGLLLEPDALRGELAHA